jgi:hypothetical protein
MVFFFNILKKNLKLNGSYGNEEIVCIHFVMGGKENYSDWSIYIYIYIYIYMLFFQFCNNIGTSAKSL